MHTVEFIEGCLNRWPEGRYLSGSDVADILGVDTSTVSSWLARGIMEHHSRLPGPRGRYNITPDMVRNFVRSMGGSNGEE